MLVLAGAVCLFFGLVWTAMILSWVVNIILNKSGSVNLTPLVIAWALSWAGFWAVNVHL